MRLNEINGGVFVLLGIFLNPSSVSYADTFSPRGEGLISVYFSFSPWGEGGTEGVG